MSTINITGNKPERRVIDSIQGLKRRGSCMHINHITIIHKREINRFNNPPPAKHRKVSSFSYTKLFFGLIC